LAGYQAEIALGNRLAGCLVQLHIIRSQFAALLGESDIADGGVLFLVLVVFNTVRIDKPGIC
jgi:hypothetical protein